MDLLLFQLKLNEYLILKMNNQDDCKETNEFLLENVKERGVVGMINSYSTIPLRHKNLLNDFKQNVTYNIVDMGPGGQWSSLSINMETYEKSRRMFYDRQGHIYMITKYINHPLGVYPIMGRSTRIQSRDIHTGRVKLYPPNYDGFWTRDPRAEWNDDTERWE